VIKIVIQTDADFTPPGKRTARVITTRSGRQLRWYVAGRIYRRLPVSVDNVALTKDWLAAQSAQHP
jgi:hypothetical protein